MIMRYHICVKENDKNLFHIVSDQSLKKPLNCALKSVAVSHGKTEATKAATQLIEDFCNVYWNKGESPDFSCFHAWVQEVLS